MVTAVMRNVAQLAEPALYHFLGVLGGCADSFAVVDTEAYAGLRIVTVGAPQGRVSLEQACKLAVCADVVGIGDLKTSNTAGPLLVDFRVGDVAASLPNIDMILGPEAECGRLQGFFFARIADFVKALSGVDCTFDDVTAGVQSMCDAIMSAEDAPIRVFMLPDDQLPESVLTPVLRPSVNTTEERNDEVIARCDHILTQTISEIRNKFFNPANEKMRGLAVGFLESAPARGEGLPTWILLTNAKARLEAIRIPILQRLRAILRAFRAGKE
jgi:hypothetical protein